MFKIKFYKNEHEIWSMFLQFQQLKILNGESSRIMQRNVMSEEKRAEFLKFTEGVIQTPPGSLALETILLFVTHHPDIIAKVSYYSSH